MAYRFLIQKNVLMFRGTHRSQCRNPEGDLSAYENSVNSLWKGTVYTVLTWLSGIISGYDNINTELLFKNLINEV